MVDIDPELIEFKDSDDDALRGMKAFWQLVLAEPEEERDRYLQEQWLIEDERRLQHMIQSNKYDDELVVWYTKQARYYATEYQHEKEERFLRAAEQYIELAQLTKRSKHSIADIRKQRERVQWQRNKITKMTETPTEPEPSSSPSENSNPTS